jgi:hypothetical protein
MISTGLLSAVSATVRSCWLHCRLPREDRESPRPGSNSTRRSRLIRLPLPRLASADSRTTAPGLVFEEGLLLRSAITLQLQPLLGRKFTLAERLGLGDVGQKLLRECVRHSVKPSQFSKSDIATRPACSAPPARLQVSTTVEVDLPRNQEGAVKVTQF